MGVITGAMVMTALLFSCLSADAVGLAMGLCSVLLGFGAGHGAADDHEHAAPDHAEHRHGEASACG
jgi:hypothetical protein